MIYCFDVTEQNKEDNVCFGPIYLNKMLGGYKKQIKALNISEAAKEMSFAILDGVLKDINLLVKILKQKEKELK